MIHKVLIVVGTTILIVSLNIWLANIMKTGEITAIKSQLEWLERNIRLAKIRAKNLKKLEADLAKIFKEI